MKASKKISRNDPCPCGSGRKHKRCCLAAEREVAAQSRRDDAVGSRILRWSTQELGAELDAAIESFAGSARQSADGAELELFSAWFHHDRALPGGRTPAELYAARPDLGAAERETAERIAAARLGLHRVLEVVPGQSLELLDLLRGSTVRVQSDKVSGEAARWDVLLARVMPGEPPSLWGPARFFSAAEEGELLSELERRARARGDEPDHNGQQAALRADPLELFRFQTPSSRAEPSFYTLEGDPMAEARASWSLRDPDAARERLARLGGYEPDEEEIELEITFPRERLIAERADKELPLGAIVTEAGALDNPDLSSVATVRIEGGRLGVEAVSEVRLERAITLIEGDFGDLVGEPEREVVPIESRLAELPGEDDRSESDPEPVDAGEQALLWEVLRDRYRSWADEPHPRLGGATPREAAAANRDAEVVPLVRAVENGAARSAREHGGGADLDLMGELGLSGERAA